MAFLGFVDPLSIAAIVVIVACIAYSYWRKALLTFTITVACGIVFALEVISTDGFIAWPLGILGDLSLANVNGYLSPPWTLITFQFLHAGFAHLLFNLLALLLIAPVFEDRIGSLRFGLLYFIGGIFGGGVFLLVNLSQPVVLVGASAGISSIFGAYGRLYPRDRVALFIPIPGFPTLPVIDVVIGFLVLETALSFFAGALGPLANVAWEAHVVAAIFGFACAPLAMHIPVGPHRSAKKVSVAGWRAVATTPELQRILEEAERADLPEIRDAWLEKFVHAMKCPQCGGPVKRRLGRLTSPCGWRARIS